MLNEEDKPNLVAIGQDEYNKVPDMYDFDLNSGNGVHEVVEYLGNISYRLEIYRSDRSKLLECRLLGYKTIKLTDNAFIAIDTDNKILLLFTKAYFINDDNLDRLCMRHKLSKIVIASRYVSVYGVRVGLSADTEVEILHNSQSCIKDILSLDLDMVRNVPRTTKDCIYKSNQLIER